MRLVNRFQRLKAHHIFLGLCLFLVVWRIPYYGKVVLDDSYITFRYAENLIERGQFTFNHDEFVLATITPIYGLLMAGFYWLGLPIPTTAVILNLLLEMTLLYLLMRLLWEYNPPTQVHNLAYVIVGILTITNRAFVLSLKLMRSGGRAC